MRDRSRVSAKFALPFAAVAMLAGFVGPARATVATLVWSGASFTNGDSYDGYVTYEYTGNSVTAVDAVSIVVGSQGTAPGYTFYYNVPGQTSNVAPPPAVVADDTTNNVYAVQVQSAGTSSVTYPEWESVGGLAALVTGFNGDGFTSYSADGSTFTDLANAGTSTAYNGTFTAAAVPEPASIVLLGLGLAGAGYFRRRV